MLRKKNMRKILKPIFRVIQAAVASMFVLPAFAAKDAVSVPVQVDHRGLLTVPGILRQNSENHWGAHNLIVKPFGGWAAQDYCLKNVKKSGGTITADFSTKPKIRMEETFKTVKDSDGRKSMKVHYKLTPPDGGTVSYERIFVSFPVASKDFAGGEIFLDNGTSFKLPEDPGEKISIQDGTKSITIKNSKYSVTFSTHNMRLSFEDMRPKMTTFQVYMDYPDPRNKSSIEFDFELKAEIVPYALKADGEKWVELPFENTVKSGSILDFSFLTEADAGKYGRIINKDGHFAFEKNGRRVRLVGNNLCYSANYIDKNAADVLALQFRRMGYNAVRFHHTDVYMLKNDWNARSSDDMSPENMDRLDYLFSVMKKNGMYVSIDLYSQRRFAKGEIDGIDQDVVCDIKGLVPVYDPAFDAWKKLVVKWMNHVNPYTGLAWKDDPALVAVCPLNEDTLSSVWEGTAKPFYLKRFKEWLGRKGLKSTVDEPRNDPLFAQFLIELKTVSDKRNAEFLRGIGVKAMLTGSNWWNTKAQTFTRDQFDMVDDHQYSDHPQPHYLPSTYNQQSNLKMHYTYMTPIFMASSRIFGKPFTVSEYNFCAPNRYRAESGVLMGAYASLQDWDGLYRFAWAHEAKRATGTVSMNCFDVSGDPLTQLAERQIILMFRRGDVSAANEKFVYGTTLEDATSKGLGDMWGKGIFPHGFNALALQHQTGSQMIASGKAVRVKCKGVVTPDDVTDAEMLNGNVHIKCSALPKTGNLVTSDTGEIELDHNKGVITVKTPKTECIAGIKGVEKCIGKLSVRGGTGFCSLSASSMDGNDLENSKRILLLHLTDILNSDIKASTSDLKCIRGWGELPFIVRAGSVEVSLRNAVTGMTLYACDCSGKRIAEVPVDYADGAYSFKAEISSKSPCPVYELSL